MLRKTKQLITNKHKKDYKLKSNMIIFFCKKTNERGKNKCKKEKQTKFTHHTSHVTHQTVTIAKKL